MEITINKHITISEIVDAVSGALPKSTLNAINEAKHAIFNITAAEGLNDTAPTAEAHKTAKTSYERVSNNGASDSVVLHGGFKA